MCVWNLKYFDELFTVETVKQSLCFRLLAQLRDMESAFDGFFEKHHLKLHQYLQLLRYEQSFQEVRIPSILSHVYIFSCASQQVCCGLLFIFSMCLSKRFLFSVQMELCLDHLMAQERELTTSVDTEAQTEQALKRLDGLESNAQVSQRLQRAALIHSLCTPDEFTTNTLSVLKCVWVCVGSVRR